jgi:hypothetical protein
LEREKEANDDKKKTSLSLSLTWAELAAQSSKVQASSTAEASARERLIEKARRGSFFEEASVACFLASRRPGDGGAVVAA